MKARDIMQTPLHILHEKTTMREAVAFFRQKHVRGAQVLNTGGVFLGILSYDDLYAGLASGARALDDDITRNIRRMICSVHPDTHIETLKSYGSSFLTVVEDGHILGGIDMMSLAETLLPPVHDSKDIAANNILQNLPDAAFLVDENWTIHWYNAMAGILCPQGTANILDKPMHVLFAESGFTVETEEDNPKSIITASRDEMDFIIITTPVSPFGLKERMVFMRSVQNNMLSAQEINKWRILSKERDAIIDSSFDGLFITDGNSHVLRVNSAYERITGITAAEVLGKKMTELVDNKFYDESVTVKVLQTKQRETIIQKFVGVNPSL